MERPGAGASHLGVTVSPIRDESGHEHGAICLFTDLSEVAELEEQLRLKDSLARLGELTAGIAHEFRNGLATIHGYGRLLDLERLPHDFRPYVQGIREETEELGQVVTNFLNFAKPAELALCPVDVGALAERAAEEIRGRGARPRRRGHRERAVRRGRGRRGAPSPGVQQPVPQRARGLCTQRARPASSSKGGSTARARCGSACPTTVPGVDPSRRWSAFSGRSSRPRPAAPGLGLALVQKIVVTHNGRVSAANAEGGGACLTVTLPLKARLKTGLSPEMLGACQNCTTFSPAGLSQNSGSRRINTVEIPT